MPCVTPESLCWYMGQFLEGLKQRKVVLAGPVDLHPAYPAKEQSDAANDGYG
jgi:hypothetical protein